MGRLDRPEVQEAQGHAGVMEVPVLVCADSWSWIPLQIHQS